MGWCAGAAWATPPRSACWAPPRVAAIILINFLSRIPVYVEPEHVRATSHMLAAAAGAVGGMTIASAVGYVVYGDRFFASTRQALPPWW